MSEYAITWGGAVLFASDGSGRTLERYFMHARVIDTIIITFPKLPTDSEEHPPCSSITAVVCIALILCRRMVSLLLTSWELLWRTV